MCGWPLGAGFAAAWLGEVLIDRGELDEAERVLTEGPLAAPASELAPVYPYTWVLQARGRLRLAQSRPHDAVVELRECGRRREAIGQVNPAIAPWRSLLAGALLDLDDRASAERLVAEELERAQQARRAAGDRHRAPRRGAARRRDPAAARGRRRARRRRRRGSSAPARTPTSAPRCTAPARPTRPARRCAAPSTSPTAAAPTRSRTTRSPSCARPAHGRAGG